MSTSIVRKYKRAVPPEIVAQMRADKLQGISLKEIARKYGISLSTTSLYCRDLFSHPSRKYQTEAEARQMMCVVSKRNNLLHPERPRYSKTRQCPNCGKMIKQVSEMCIDCRRALRRRMAMPPPLVRTRSNNGKQRRNDADRQRHINLDIQRINSAIDSAKRRDETERGRKGTTPKRLPPILLDECPNNPGQGHYWVLDRYNHGICKACDISRRFSGGSWFASGRW